LFHIKHLDIRELAKLVLKVLCKQVTKHWFLVLLVSIVFYIAEADRRYSKYCRLNVNIPLKATSVPNRITWFISKADG
jgi:hypothetical protein